ncbi:MAG: DMT family transporter [Chloroflexota bacterium]
MNRNILNNFLLFIPGITWGVTFIIVELILPVIPPITLTLLRTIISTTMLLFLLRYVGGRLPTTLRGWGPFFVLGAFNMAIPFALSGWGQLYIEGGLAAILISPMPLFTAILAHFFVDGERLTLHKISGISLGILGIVILIGPNALAGVSTNIVAQLAIVFCALMYAIGAVYLRLLFPHQPKDLSIWAIRLRLMTGQFTAASIILLPFSLLLEAPWTIRPTLEIWGYMLFLGIGVTLMATMTYFYLIENLGPSRTVMTNYLIPGSGMLAGVLLLGEQLTIMRVVAMVLVLCGIFIVNRANLRAAG